MESNNSPKIKTAIITGASSGIGKALVYQYFEAGYNVVLAARNEEGINSIAQELNIKGRPNKAYSKATDVCKAEDCKSLIDYTLSQCSSIDVLINNAGISMRSFFADTDLEVLKKVMDVNFWGTVYCTRYAIAHLIESKGTVIGVSSIAGYKGLPGRTGYSASKFAMHGFLESVRIENRETGLRVLIACPGFVSTAIRTNALNGDGSVQSESPRDEAKMMTPEYVANQIYEGMMRSKSYIILGFQGKLTVWLNKFFPGLVDGLVFKTMNKEEGSPFKMQELIKRGYIKTKKIHS